MKSSSFCLNPDATRDVLVRLKEARKKLALVFVGSVVSELSCHPYMRGRS